MSSNLSNFSKTGNVCRFVFNQKLNWVDEILVVPVYWEWLIRFWLADKFSFRRFSSSLTKYRQLNLLLNYC
jgi:hypothetical protein